MNKSNVQSISLVVPVYNEAENIEALIKDLLEVLTPLSLDWEVWLVDDGSTDASPDLLKKFCQLNPRLGYACFSQNMGQSAAFAAGFSLARGEVIVTMDGDLQNNPADIPVMLKKYQQGFDMVIGWRVKRRDTAARRFASWIANRVRNALTSEQVQDTGCSLKLMRADLARQIPMFQGMHRFLPTLMRMYGAKVAEMPVDHRPRYAGKSKYGTFSRGWAAFQDLLVVNWMLRRHRSWTIEKSHQPLLGNTQNPSTTTAPGSPANPEKYL